MGVTMMREEPLQLDPNDKLDDLASAKGCANGFAITFMTVLIVLILWDVFL